MSELKPFDLYELEDSAQALFDNWNDMTGALCKGTSWYAELREGVIEDIVGYVYGKTLLLNRRAQPENKPIDAVPVVRGEWKTWEEQFPDRTTRKKNDLGVFCSACQLHADNMTSYCPNCGAKMEDKT